LKATVRFRKSGNVRYNVIKRYPWTGKSGFWSNNFLARVQAT
jgi:hypothetical protein